MVLKKKILGVCIFFASVFGFSQEKLIPKVDERVEAVSIVFRLAGAEEYSRNDNKKYAEDIRTYFEPFKNSEIIEFIKENRNQNGLGNDAVMSMATHISFEKNKFKLITEKENTLDKRWAKVDIKKFVSLLNEFYKKTNFQKFFNNHAENYAKAEKEYQKVVLSDFNQNWYSKFYGKTPNEEYEIILGFGNGGGNYGIKVNPKNGKTIVNAIVGVWNFDENGEAKFDKNEFQALLIHEFNHSFINYILEMKDYHAQLQNSSEKIYKLVEKDMKSQAYGNWETMINESLVRASVIRYMIDNNYSQKEINEEILIQRGRKFLWIKELVDLLGNYEQNRQKYPTLESFYPEIITFYNNLEPNLKTLINQQPKVVSVSPDIWNKEDVDASITEITVNFSTKLSSERMNVKVGNLGMEHFPLKQSLGFENDNKSIKFKVELKPNTEYEFILGNRFRDQAGFPLEETTIKFKTK